MIFEEYLSKRQQLNKTLSGGSNFLFPSSCSNSWLQSTGGGHSMKGHTMSISGFTGHVVSIMAHGAREKHKRNKNDNSEHAHSVPRKGQ